MVVCSEKLHNSPALKAEAATFGVPVLDFDGIAEVWVESVEDWKVITGDEEFVRVIAGELPFCPYLYLRNG